MNKILNNKRSLFSLITLLLIFIAALCAGCQSPQETNGVSLLPQNRPITTYSSNMPIGGITF